jgi:glycosyltransferase involved in cell wall biosynthesis
LRQFAGCDFDHYVLDNGSLDGTQDWLRNEYAPKHVEIVNGNIGVCRGINRLLEKAKGYDWYVKFDNDCELTVENTLRDSLQSDEWILSPQIHGLLGPVAVQEETFVGQLRVGRTNLLGGIFMAVPGWVFNNGYRHNEQNPIWGMDDDNIVKWFHEQGGKVGYMLDYPAWHYETTDGQKMRYPAYFERKYAEFYR